jgi:hypothetical protein
MSTKIVSPTISESKWTMLSWAEVLNPMIIEVSAFITSLLVVYQLTRIIDSRILVIC